ncbi:NADH oxidase [uncultured spirochete]|jgi:2,4-dienoyl-CoA reductase-like NADH-dependent reductase (Old Yellow Enzyme family)/thioredoxin reductase|uniref:NADH oxidase n=1 Tax=uncultured spirochete TaxID=156406 RepID=A0A3P3XM85_9SPIR|nr:NADH oxidase [uncultured spirochete]
MALQNLFSEGRIGTLTLKNRVVFPPMGTNFPEDEKVSKSLIDYHVARAKGGCGLNIVEIAAVHPTSRGTRTLGIYDDKFIPGLKTLADAIHEAGGKAAVQIWHAGRQTNSAVTGLPIVSASPIPCPLCQEMPRELTLKEIKELVEAYGDAALRAKKAGFDAIELHGAHGYLIAQFMSPYSNHRGDNYGGSLENRARFALEIIADVRKKVGNDYPVLYRLSSEERVKNGLTFEDTKKIAKLIEKAGVDAIHVSVGVYETLHYTVPPIDLPVGFNVPGAAAVKSAVHIPVIAVDRINDPVLADQILRDGNADFIAMGRGQIADPELCNKAQRGDFDSIVKCIGCNQGCVDRLLMQGLSVSCLRNPSTGRESEYAIKPADKRKKVLVIGGGAAGLEAATTLSRRGHEVILCEKNDSLGGQFFLAGVAPGKKEMSDAALQMGRTAEKTGVAIRLGTELTEELLGEINPDEVVVATGSVPFIPEIPGNDKPHVVTAIDVLKGKKTTGNSVAVIGGGLVGIEVAEYLREKGKKVTIVEMLDEVAKELGMLRRPFAFQYIKEHAIEVYTSATCTEIKDNSLVIEQNGKRKEIGGIDTVVMATGVKPYNAVVDILKKAGCTYHTIGDASASGKALDAIWAGASIGRAI